MLGYNEERYGLDRCNMIALYPRNSAVKEEGVRPKRKAIEALRRAERISKASRCVVLAARAASDPGDKYVQKAYDVGLRAALAALAGTDEEDARELKRRVCRLPTRGRAAAPAGAWAPPEVPGPRASG